MRKKVFNVMMALAVGMAAVLMVTSCSNDNNDGNDGKKPFVDQQAGTFKIINQSYDDGTTGPEFIALPGDTLKVTFTPKNDYKSHTFKVSCEGLNQLNDSMFVVKKNASGSTDYTVSAEYKNETDSTITNYSAQTDIEITVPESYVIIPYRLTLSQDLKELVTPEVTYTDADGKQHTFIVKDWNETEYATTTRFYVRYYKVGVTTKVEFRYIPKQDVSLTRNIYFLSRTFDRESATIHIPNMVNIDIYTTINIPLIIGGDGTYGTPKEDVSTAIEELSRTVDVLKFSIDEMGHIEKIEE